jgi:hypothetical protein
VEHNKLHNMALTDYLFCLSNATGAVAGAEALRCMWCVQATAAAAAAGCFASAVPAQDAALPVTLLDCTHHDLFQLLVRRHRPAIDVNGHALEQLAMLCLLQLCCFELLLQLQVLILHVQLEATTVMHGSFILLGL